MKYKDAGVDIEKADLFVEKIKKIAGNSIGDFGGLYPFGDGWLVASADGVGTKILVLDYLKKYEVIGWDLVAMNVNDILTFGAEPLFFMDYFACGKLDLERAEKIIKGIVDACKESNCVLLGGETAELPDLIDRDKYDLGGFVVGFLKNKPSKIEKGDILYALPSNGFHSNGFSLIRKILKDKGISFEDEYWSKVLTKPTRIYVKDVLPLFKKNLVKRGVHVTGGGIEGNLKRILGGLGYKIYYDWEVPQEFKKIQKLGGIPDEEMRKVFNLGIGFILILEKDKFDEVKEILKEGFVVGEIV